MYWPRNRLENVKLSTNICGPTMEKQVISHQQFVVRYNMIYTSLYQTLVKKKKKRQNNA